MPSSEVEKEMKIRRSLLDFLKKVLQTDPMERLTPQQAVHHPFITGNHVNVEECDELISLGKHIKKRVAHPDDDDDLSSSSSSSTSSSNCTNCTDRQAKEGEEQKEGGKDEEEVPLMLTGVRRKSFANKEPRSSTSISPYSRKRYGSILTPLASPPLEKGDSPLHPSLNEPSSGSSSVIQNSFSSRLRHRERQQNNR